MELTKKEIDTLFSENFLDNNGNIDKDKIKSLNTNLLHSLAETFSDTYKVKTRYTAEQLLKKLMDDFKVSMRNPVSLSDVKNLPKVIKTGYLLFDGRAKLSDYTYKLGAKNQVFVNGTLDYNMMNMVDLYCLSNIGFREDLATGKVRGCSILPFKHMPAACVVSPSGGIRVKKEGKLKIGTTDLDGNEILTLHEIFCFIITDVVKNLSDEEKQDLAASIKDCGLVNFYSGKFDWNNCFADKSILERNNINDVSVYYPNDLELMRGVNLLCIREQSCDISYMNKNGVNFVKVTDFESADKTYNVYYNEHIFDNHGKRDITLQDYIYLKDVILRVMGYLKVVKTPNRVVTVNGKKSITYIYKPYDISKDDVRTKLQGILRGYKLITPFIKKVDFGEKLNSTYYYQVV